MGLLGDLLGPLVGLVLSGLLFVGVALVGIVDLVSVLARPESTVAGFLGTAVPYLLGLVVLAAVAAACGAWALYRLATAVDTDALDSDRLVDLADRARRRFD